MERHESESCPFCQSGEWFHAPALPTYPDAHVMAPVETKWVMFTKRTEDPKLAWLEARLGDAGVPCRRKGNSFHAPILEVPEDRLDSAWSVLTPEVDDMDDDDPEFADPKFRST